MRTILIVGLILVPTLAVAQAFPAGSGTLTMKEKVKVSRCGSVGGVDSLAVTVNANGTWTAQSDSGTLSGSLMPADTKGLKWDLMFDAPSRSDYEEFLEDVASFLCESPATVHQLLIKKFQAKFKKDLRTLAIQLKSKAEGATLDGPGKGSHSLKAKGSFEPQS